MERSSDDGVYTCNERKTANSTTIQHKKTRSGERVLQTQLTFARGRCLMRLETVAYTNVPAANINTADTALFVT